MVLLIAMIVGSYYAAYRTPGPHQPVSVCVCVCIGIYITPILRHTFLYLSSINCAFLPDFLNLLSIRIHIYHEFWLRLNYFINIGKHL